MKIKSSIVINDAYDRHRKNFALIFISSLFRKLYIQLVMKRSMYFLQTDLSNENPTAEGRVRRTGEKIIRMWWQLCIT